MTGYDVQLLEQRIAAIEERLGIEGSKTLAEAAAEQAERDNKASGQQFRAKYADREISTYVLSRHPAYECASKPSSISADYDFVSQQSSAR